MVKKVLLGLSGGIDSFVSALLLKNQGYEVIGVTFLFYGTTSDQSAARLAQELSIKHMYKDLRNPFQAQVIDKFTQSYLNARTPSPCSWCNRTMKWQQLAQLADELEIPFIATGHYVQIRKKGNLHYVFQGVDEVKDQSYFLWELDESILQRAITPLGTYTKAQVRNLARENGFRQLARKKESMGVCFLQGLDYRNFLQEELGEEWHEYARPGKVFDENGNQVGTH
ncbi:MAG: 7-cyano-7-deazaguanine synthase, partial [Bacteroidales bacterium]